MARQGAAEGTVLIAGRQTGGRGRLGRRFASPAGGLYLSMLLLPGCTPEESLSITPLAAVAVRRAVKACTGSGAAYKMAQRPSAGRRKALRHIDGAELRRKGAAPSGAGYRHQCKHGWPPGGAGGRLHNWEHRPGDGQGRRWRRGLSGSLTACMPSGAGTAASSWRSTGPTAPPWAGSWILFKTAAGGGESAGHKRRLLPESGISGGAGEDIRFGEVSLREAGKKP